MRKGFEKWSGRTSEKEASERGREDSSDLSGVPRETVLVAAAPESQRTHTERRTHTDAHKHELPIKFSGSAVAIHSLPHANLLDLRTKNTTAGAPREADQSVHCRGSNAMTQSADFFFFFLLDRGKWH